MQSAASHQRVPSALFCVSGNGSALVRLLQEGTCKLEELGSYGGEELQFLLEQCDIPFGPEDSRVSAGSGAWGFGSRQLSVCGIGYKPHMIG